MDFKWSIEKMVVAGDANLVTQVYWYCNAVDNELTASTAGIRNLVASDFFIPYNQLTEQQVLDWCFSAEVIDLDDETSTTKLLKNDVEAQIFERISQQRAQVAAEPALPWVTA